MTSTRLKDHIWMTLANFVICWYIVTIIHAKLYAEGDALVMGWIGGSLTTVGIFIVIFILPHHHQHQRHDD